jgi:hypothetical protein
LEIENPSVGNGAKFGDIADALSETQHVEMRDDRYVAARSPGPVRCLSRLRERSGSRSETG